MCPRRAGPRPGTCSPEPGAPPPLPLVGALGCRVPRACACRWKLRSWKLAPGAFCTPERVAGDRCLRQRRAHEGPRDQEAFRREADALGQRCQECRIEEGVRGSGGPVHADAPLRGATLSRVPAGRPAQLLPRPGVLPGRRPAAVHQRGLGTRRQLRVPADGPGVDGAGLPRPGAPALLRRHVAPGREAGERGAHWRPEMRKAHGLRDVAAGHQLRRHILFRQRATRQSPLCCSRGHQCAGPRLPCGLLLVGCDGLGAPLRWLERTAAMCQHRPEEGVQGVAEAL
mmetsp:Transcript_13359/g.38992  ORF Transcript_13359/g.38992 Transcript_13359/m.38992 type:complete len:285 (-) Transcript_13359:293-1147(-)